MHGSNWKCFIRTLFWNGVAFGWVLSSWKQTSRYGETGVWLWRGSNKNSTTWFSRTINTLMHQSERIVFQANLLLLLWIFGWIIFGKIETSTSRSNWKLSIKRNYMYYESLNFGTIKNLMQRTEWIFFERKFSVDVWSFRLIPWFNESKAKTLLAFFGKQNFNVGTEFKDF